MNLFELFVKIGVDDQASKNINNITTKLGNGLQTAAKVGTAAVTIATTAITALTASAVKNYAEYEQLIGGAELMFGKAFDTVKNNAQNAYKTVQMSQNEYLKQVNGFATGLKTALGGNEQAAADLAHRIIQAEADVIAATGNTEESVKNAFNGIMRSNFTMLDNLQLGIKPTKEGFQEVIDKVNEWNAANGEATAYQMGNLADMQSALVDYIDMVGMAGYASKEAAKTISGSVASMKAAWKNLITGFADDTADLDVLMDNFLETIFGTNGEGGVLNNLLPRIEITLESIITFLEKLLIAVAENLPSIAERLLPQFGQAILKVIDVLLSTLDQNADKIMESGVKFIAEFLKGIITYLPKLVLVVIKLIFAFVEEITKPENLGQLLIAATAMIEALANGLIEALPNLLERIPNILEQIVDSMLTWITQEGGLFEVGLSLWESLLKGFVYAAVPWVKNVIEPLFAAAENIKVNGKKIEFSDFSNAVQGLISYDVFEEPTDNFAATSEVGEGAASSYQSKSVTVNQYIYSQAQTAADLMEEAITRQEMEALFGV